MTSSSETAFKAPLITYLRDTLGAVQTTASLDLEQGASVDLLRFSDVPDVGIDTHATAGLASKAITDQYGNPYSFGAEFIAAVPAGLPYFDAVMRACVSRVIAEDARVHPGAVLTNLFRLFPGTDEALIHGLCVPPFLWPDALGLIELAARDIRYLQIIPITDAERTHAASEGFDALEALFEREQVDIFDFQRGSVL